MGSESKIHTHIYIIEKEKTKINEYKRHVSIRMIEYSGLRKERGQETLGWPSLSNLEKSAHI